MNIVAKAFLTDAQSARMERIIEATLALIGNVGAERMTMRQIAAASRVSAATLYNRFGTKDNLTTMAVLWRYEHHVLSIVNAHTAGKSPLQKVVYLLEVQTAANLAAPQFARALMSSYFKIDNDRQMPNGLLAIVRSTWKPFIEEMQSARSLRDWVSVPMLIDELSDRLFAVVMQWVQGGFPDSEFAQRLDFAVISVLLACSRGKQAEEAEAVLARALARSAKRASKSQARRTA